ncbi:metallophosphoesterase [Bacteroides sp. 51]|uniref:metallophosphoesterase n=1 Tax=Bacteroides sp. 51 TaxID=2302938 RepID=UPI0013D2FCF3|nr:metallophosphoesterase [Bacteroides sp. 51]NDV84030.1 metallophosphoesterase [Bacteroides sp. 51]
MKAVYFILMILFFLGINFYVFYRLVYMLPPVVALRGIVIGVGIAVILGFFGYFFGREFLPQGLVSIMYTVSSSWIFMSIYFLIIFLILDILRIIPGVPVEAILYKNWISFAVIVGAVAVVFIYGYNKYLNKERVELDITVSKTNHLNTPLKIVALSDLHLGNSIGRDEFAGWVEMINKEQPDIVLLAGDVIDFDVRPLYDQNMAEVFKQIKSKYGIYGVMGNHEYIAGADKSTEFYEEAGIHLLRDASQLINGQFYIVGRDDHSYYGRKSIWELTDSLDKSKPIIVLDHQPHKLDEVVAHGVDLQISGHTHHGQVWPISWITNAMYEVSHGYKQKENTHFYVSSGMGLWGGKYRIGTQSEYVVISLK